ncbi:guanylate kinase [Asanoa sp. NPDC050611]|uniref:guanylate kinase n=1 Tax=Asanoa sp. NPDC050611 TaxID=3157098 RepID=UPI0033D5FE83
MTMHDEARPAARLTVLTGPSEAGRAAVIRLVRARSPWVRIPVMVTTRRRRDHEVDGVHYTFVDEAAYDRLIAEQGLLESAAIRHHRYGTPRRPVDAWLAAGEPVLLSIDPRGAELVTLAVPDARVVLLLAPHERVTAAGDGIAGAIINHAAGRAADELVGLLGSPFLTPARPPRGG